MGTKGRHRPRPRERDIPLTPEALRAMGEQLRPVTEARLTLERDATARLARLGYEAAFTSSAAPVQIEGTLPTAERFYFRARWDRAHLEVGRREDADSFAIFARGAGNWRRGERRWTAPEASWLDPLDAIALLDAWVRERMAGRPGDSAPFLLEPELAATLVRARRRRASYVTLDRRILYLGGVDPDAFMRTLEGAPE